MLILDGRKFHKSEFNNEEELEDVIRKHYDILFGEYSIYLSQKAIKTVEGFSSVPDAIVVDFENRVWYIVEVELAKHGVWNHIVPQITKQIVAVENPEMRRNIVDLFMEEIKRSKELKDRITSLNVNEMEIREILEKIIEKPPIIAIPIDSVSADLKYWARVVKNEVWLLEVIKYTNDEVNKVIYSVPEYFHAVEEPESSVDKEKAKITVDEFLRRCEEPGRILFQELQRIASERSSFVRLEARQLSFSFRVRVHGKDIALLTVFPDAVFIHKLGINPENGFKVSAIEAFAEKIKQISGISERYDIMKQPGFSTRAVDVSVDDIKLFVEAIENLIDSLMQS